ncbi:MAG: hypothetical protein Q7R65_04815 [bacterium]|nr:hypothetical protein [bacterium]
MKSFIFVGAVLVTVFTIWFIHLANPVTLLPKILLVLAGMIAGGIATLLVIVLIVLVVMAALHYFPHF